MLYYPNTSPRIRLAVLSKNVVFFKVLIWGRGWFFGSEDHILVRKMVDVYFSYLTPFAVLCMYINKHKFCENRIWEFPMVNGHSHKPINENQFSTNFHLYRNFANMEIEIITFNAEYTYCTVHYYIIYAKTVSQYYFNGKVCWKDFLSSYHNGFYSVRPTLEQDRSLFFCNVIFVSIS